MAGILQPDLESVEGRAALKSVIKWEIQSLVNRLAETGEEALVLTASLEDDHFTELGSNRGQNFMKLSNLDIVKTQFLTYCKACFINGDLSDFSSRDLNLHVNTESLLNSNSTRPKLKSRKRKHSMVKQELASSMVEGGVCLDTLPLDISSTNGIVETNHMTMKVANRKGNSRRKRTPKKLRLEEESCHSNSDTDDYAAITSGTIEIKLEPDWDKEFANENQPTGFHSTGTSTSNFLQSKLAHLDGNQSIEVPSVGSQSVSLHQINSACQTGNHSTDSDASSSKDGTQLKTIRSKKMVSILGDFRESMKKCKKKNTFSGVDTEEMNSNNSSVFSKNSSVKSKNSSKESSSGRLKVKLKTREIKSEKLDPTCNALEPLVDAGHSEGETTLVGETSKGLQALLSKFNLDLDTITPEDLDKLSFRSPIRPPGRGFKAAASDEHPIETAILDAAKLGIGRYQCLWCSLIVRDRHDLKRHLRTHTKQKPYQCEQCLRKFSRKWDLENHLKRHLEESLNDKLMSDMPLKTERMSEEELQAFWLKNKKAELQNENDDSGDRENEVGDDLETEDEEERQNDIRKRRHKHDRESRDLENEVQSDQDNELLNDEDENNPQVDNRRSEIKCEKARGTNVKRVEENVEDSSNTENDGDDGPVENGDDVDEMEEDSE